MEHKCIAIHRGRNKETTRLFKSVTDVDYTFDFRGVYGGSPLNPFWLLLKAWITSKEIPKAKHYLIEGGMLFWIGFFLKKRFPHSQLILMVPEAAYFLDPKKNFLQKAFFKFRLKKMSENIDLFLPITEMVKEDILNYNPQSRAIRISHSVEVIPTFNYKPQDKIKIMFVMDRPQDTAFIKGWDRVQKIAKALESQPRFQFLICGAGTEALSSPLKNLTFCGRVHMETFLSDVDISLTPSRYDALCRVVGEAISTGTIPLLSNRVGIKEIFSDYSQLVIEGDDTESWVQTIIEVSNWSLEKRKEAHLNITKKMERYRPEEVLKTFSEAIHQFIGD